MFRLGDELVPGYRLQRMLGRGGFGQVWSAGGPGGTRVALKIIDLEGRQGTREFRAVQRVKEIRHPNLMPITAIWVLDIEGRPLDERDLAALEQDHAGQHDSGQRDSKQGAHQRTLAPDERRGATLVLGMLLGDCNLFDRLTSCQQQGWTGIPVEELLSSFEEAAKGLDFLNSQRHDLGAGPVAIQHGDVKPHNMMLVGGSIQVCDFGLARVLCDTHVTTGMSGSPAYLAPECIEHNRPSHATDQYSLAISYVELRTGALPFDCESYLGVIEAHRLSRLDLSRLDEAECQVIRRATALNPFDRFASCQEFVRTLRAACAAAASIELEHAGVYAASAGHNSTSTGTLRAGEKMGTGTGDMHNSPGYSQQRPEAVPNFSQAGTGTPNRPAMQGTMVADAYEFGPSWERNVVTETAPLDRGLITTRRVKAEPDAVATPSSVSASTSQVVAGATSGISRSAWRKRALVASGCVLCLAVLLLVAGRRQGWFMNRGVPAIDKAGLVSSPPVRMWQVENAASGTAEDAGENRSAADWVLEIGGKLEIRLAGTEKLSLSRRGQIPREPFVVVGVDLEGCAVGDRDLAALGCLDDLQTLRLKGTQVTDAGIAHLARLDDLDRLDLWRTYITDQGLKTISGLTSLTCLNVGSTMVGDAGLAHIRELDRLTNLGLDHTAVSDHGLASLASMNELVYLSLAGTQVRGPGLKALASMQRLKSLDLSFTPVDGRGLDVLATLGRLEILSLSGSKVTNNGLRDLAGLTSLKEIWLSYTSVGDPGLSALTHCRRLQRLFLTQSRVSPEGIRLLNRSLPDLRIER